MFYDHVHMNTHTGILALAQHLKTALNIPPGQNKGNQQPKPNVRQNTTNGQTYSQSHDYMFNRSGTNLPMHPPPLPIPPLMPNSMSTRPYMPLHPLPFPTPMPPLPYYFNPWAWNPYGTVMNSPQSVRHERNHLYKRFKSMFLTMCD